MTCIVPRTCREVSSSNSRARSELTPQPVEAWEYKAAYVLLGAPGAGKTTTFEHEAKRQEGVYVTVRDFLTSDDKPEWHDTTLFVDGLDESRAGTADGRTPLDRIRAKLERIGCPRFRLSCREADWFGRNDSDNLKTVSPDETVTVLRLEPLSGDDIYQFLSAFPGIGNAENFITSARNRGLQGLLANPQSLKMLAVAVGPSGKWPSTRMQAFDMACRTLLKEHNDEHRIAQPGRSSISDLMNACGRLFAIQLLTGAVGYSQFGNGSDPDFLGLDQVPEESRAILHSCLQSKLFESPIQCRAVPVHRQIAEFLAARFLAGLVDKGLPVGRVLALMTGYDGIVVSELRGLSAWLAAHSGTGRAEVIARDPLGTVLYGDISRFSPSDRLSLLNGLHRETNANPKIFVTHHLDSRLGDLVSSDMEEHFREILLAPTREESCQSFVIILLEALWHGERLPGLADPLKELIRDGTWWPRLRERALDLYIRHFRNCRELGELAAEIHVGKVSDPDDDLLGCLLSRLYPASISEVEVMRYLRIPQRLNYINEYYYFWTEHLPQISTSRQLEVLLDHIVERYDNLFADTKGLWFHVSFLRRLHASLLTRFLQLAGDETDLSRLFSWLEPAATECDWENDPDIVYEEFRDVLRWVNDRPGAWKTLLAMSLNRCIERSECNEPYGFANCMRKEENGRLFGVNRPPDFGLWCLERAVEVENENAAGWLLDEAAMCLHYGLNNNGLSRETVSMSLAGYTGLRHAFEERLAEFEAPQTESCASGRRSQAHIGTKRLNWHVQVKPHEGKLLGTEANPALLHELAEKVYFGGYANVPGDSPRERLNAVLDGDESLVDAVLVGFRNTVKREDLPSDSQVIKLRESNQTHYLALPFMAGLEEIAKTVPLGEMDIGERLLRLALAVHYTVPMRPSAQRPAGHKPQWFNWLLLNCPHIVADVLARSVLSELRKGVESPAGIHELAHSPDHAGVARIAAVSLLQRFPVRCRSGQLSSLSHLIIAARRHCGPEPLLELIDKKHIHPGMNVAQRVHWLAAGLCIAPETYIDRLKTYVGATERRVRFLSEAVANQFISSPDLKCCQNISALQLLIRLIGTSCRPYPFGADSDVDVLATHEFYAANRVHGFIDELATISTEDASHALEALSSEIDLRAWNSLLTDATHRQKALRREAGFVYGDVAQVIDTLERGPPTNAADLAALTFEHLQRIARNIRDGNTSDWRQYWNVDSHYRPMSPRPENACRDALLSDLKTAMQPSKADVQREGNYADDKRADIRVSYGEFNVPIEVKRSCHKSLWSAIRSQLIAKYVTDPGTGGYGIYVVFWFGDTEDCRPTPPMTGARPASSLELERRLTSMLSAEEQIRIRVCVVDVSAPQGQGGGSHYDRSVTNKRSKVKHANQPTEG